MGVAESPPRANCEGRVVHERTLRKRRMTTRQAIEPIRLNSAEPTRHHAPWEMIAEGRACRCRLGQMQPPTATMATPTPAWPHRRATTWYARRLEHNGWQRRELATRRDTPAGRSLRNSPTVASMRTHRDSAEAWPQAERASDPRRVQPNRPKKRRTSAVPARLWPSSAQTAP